MGGLAGISPPQLDTLRNGLRIMALRALGSADAAEDAVQETLLRALSAVTQEIAADDVRLGAFLGGIARHVIADMQRRDARFTSLADYREQVSRPDALTALIDSEQRAAVTDALAQLSEPDRELLRACFFEELSAVQLTERLNQSAEAIRKRKSRALARLRRVFEQNGHSPTHSPSIVQARLPLAAEGGR